jgi:hypothetical protein
MIKDDTKPLLIKNKRQRPFNIVVVDFEEFKPETYKGVYVLDVYDMRHNWTTGDIIKDFEYAVNYAVNTGNDTVYSSSVDDFLMDSEGYEYDANNLIIRKP